MVSVYMCMGLYTRWALKRKVGELGIALGKHQFSDCRERDGEHRSASVYLHDVSAF